MKVNSVDWQTLRIPLNGQIFIWVKQKKKTSKKANLIIEIKDQQVLLIHYSSRRYAIDIDKP